MPTSITQIYKTGLGKALVLLWALALLLLIGLLLFGCFYNEIFGNMAFGFLLISIVLNTSIIISYKVENGSLQIVKACWSVISVLILGVTFYFFDGKPNSDIAVFLSWAMLVHSFPISLIVNLHFAGISYLLYNAFSVNMKVGYLYLFVVWLVFFISGYFQWFKLIPFFIRSRLRKQ